MGSCAPRFCFVRFLFPIRNFKNVQKARAAPILGTRASPPAAILTSTSSQWTAGCTEPSSPARFRVLRKPDGSLWPFCAATILTRLEGAFLCVLCSRGEAAPRLPIRQRAAPEARGTREGQGSGRGRAATEAWARSPGVQALPLAGLRAPSHPHPPPPPREAVTEDSDSAPVLADLREETESRRRRAGALRRPENR